MRIENPRVGGSIPSPDTINPMKNAPPPVQRVRPSPAESGTNRYARYLTWVSAIAIMGCAVDVCGYVPEGASDPVPDGQCYRVEVTRGPVLLSPSEGACEELAACVILYPGEQAHSYRRADRDVASDARQEYAPLAPDGSCPLECPF